MHPAPPHTLLRSLVVLALPCVACVACARPVASGNEGEGEGGVVAAEGEGEGRVVGDEGEGEGRVVGGEGEGEGHVVVGEGEGEGVVVVAEGEGEGEGVPAPDPDAVPFVVEGFGAATRGGWQPGHDELLVTSLDDDGPGSLRDTLRARFAPDAAPAVIHFALDGDIVLQTPMLVPPRVSIDGAGHVIRIRGKGFVLGGSDDVILTRLTIRDVGPDSEDGVQMGGVNDPAVGVVLDHLSFLQDGNAGDSSNVDEAISAVFGSHDITIQWCVVDNWEKGMLFGNGDVGADVDGPTSVTVHHNVFTRTGRRHPQARYGRYDVSNNLLDGWHMYGAFFLPPFRESFGAQIQDDGQLIFEHNVVRRSVGTFDTGSQANDVTRCETGGRLYEEGTFTMPDSTAPLRFGVGCTNTTVFARPYALALDAADATLATTLRAHAGALAP